MARGINKVILIGRLGADPELKYMPSGNGVVNINLATNESWRDKQTGERQERTEWHRLVFYGKLAEIVAQYQRKGSQLYIEGRLQTRKWQAQDGLDRYITEIVVVDMEMLDSKNTADFDSARPGQYAPGAQSAGMPAPGYGGQQPASPYASAQAPAAYPQSAAPESYPPSQVGGYPAQAAPAGFASPASQTHAPSPYSTSAQPQPTPIGAGYPPQSTPVGAEYSPQPAHRSSVNAATNTDRQAKDDFEDDIPF